jgi:hypothetical protein
MSCKDLPADLLPESAASSRLVSCSINKHAPIINSRLLVEVSLELLRADTLVLPDCVQERDMRCQARLE